jgi:hypothetical protein
MIQLMRKQLFPEMMETLYDRPFSLESVSDDFEVKDGNWFVEDGWLIGENRKNSDAMIFSKQDYLGDIFVEFDASTVEPATHDINVTWHGSWNDETGHRDMGYVAGIQGFWEGMIGFEQSPRYDLYAVTKLFPFVPGQIYHISVGNIGADCFVAVDGVLALQVRVPNPIDTNIYGRVGFEAFCTRVRYKNLKIKRLTYVDSGKPYEPEF